MSLVVEDGSGLADSESYVSVADCATYATNNGLSFAASPLDAAEAALRRATQAIDAMYRTRYPGQRKKFRLQALEWPRVGVVDAPGYPVADDEIPKEVVAATCEAAVRELGEPGTMQPDLERGGMISALQAGSVSITYAGGASPNTIFQKIDGILSALIGAQSQYMARAVRA